MNLKLNSHGNMGLSCGVICFFVAATGIGLLSLHARWHRQVEGQLALDQCVAQTARRIRSLVMSLDQDNQAIKIARASLAATTLLPPARAALETTLMALVLHQEGLLVAYRVGSVAWLSQSTCEDVAHLARPLLPTPLAPLPVFRDLPDPIGPKPLRWLETPVKLAVQLNWQKRSSRAELLRKEGENENSTPLLSNSNWTLRWVAPKFWPSFP